MQHTISQNTLQPFAALHLNEEELCELLTALSLSPREEAEALMHRLALIHRVAFARRAEIASETREAFMTSLVA